MLDSPSLCSPPCPASSRHAPFKLDEGYSEETRSQYDSDSTMGIELGNVNLMDVSMPPMSGLPEAMMALTEAERTGKAIF